MALLAVGTACGDAAADAAAVRARGIAHLDAGHHDMAIRALDSAIALRRDDADAYNARGNAYAAKRQLPLAIQSFDSAIRLRPGYAAAFRNRGVAYSSMDSLSRALQDFDQAIALAPDLSSAYNSRGFVRQLLGDHARALEDFDKSIQLTPDRFPAYRNRANAHLIFGHFGDAANDLQRAVKLYDSLASRPPAARLDETGAYSVVWLHVARMRQGVDDAAEWAANSARVDPVEWPRPVVEFFDGRITADQLVAGTARVADPKLRSDQRCGAEFFAGQAAMWRKQPAEAKRRFETMTSTCSRRFVEHAIASAELGRMGARAP